MDFLEKDERDYVSNVKSLQDYIKLLMARAFIYKLKPGDQMEERLDQILETKIEEKNMMQNTKMTAALELTPLKLLGDNPSPNNIEKSDHSFSSKLEYYDDLVSLKH